MNSRYASVTFKKIKLSHMLMHLIFIIFLILYVIPLLLVISISLSDETTIVQNGFKLIPQQFSLEAYKFIFVNPEILINAYAVTITITVLGVFFGTLFTAMLAYSLSRNNYAYKKSTTLYVFFTMLFNGGLVPWYILITKYLHMQDTIFALFVPSLIVPFFALLLKGFLTSIPESIFESAKIDGANELFIFFRIVIPLSTPALATVGLFYTLLFWNNWFLGMLFIENPKLVPLQLLLYRIMSTIAYLNENISKGNVGRLVIKLPGQTARMALCVMAAGPMLFAFPFFQKYFVKGLVVGAVKG